MRAYSLDLPQQLLAALHTTGIDKAEVARVFRVSRRTINRYRKRLAEPETVAATPLPGRQRQRPPAQHPIRDAHQRALPDATLAEH
jgi:transposase